MAKKLSLEIELGNEQMKTRIHVAAALRMVAENIMSKGLRRIEEDGPRKIMDLNGNSVGFWKIEDT
jgi:hypothetical protein